MSDRDKCCRRSGETAEQKWPRKSSRFKSLRLHDCWGIDQDSNEAMCVFGAVRGLVWLEWDACAGRQWTKRLQSKMGPHTIV